MQQIQLNIPEPCHEDWQNMTPTEQGRFCNACAKQVVDFSLMTDTQVLNYFSNIKNEKVCGRAYPDQLDRMITMPKEPKKRLFWHWNYITMLFLFFSKTNTAKAQKTMGYMGTKTVQANYTINNLFSDTNPLSIKNSQTIIAGKITDDNGNPIPFASIKIMGGEPGTGIAADQLGNFSLKVNIETAKLEIDGSGYFKALFRLKGLVNYNFILEKNPDLKTVVGPTVYCRSNRLIKGIIKDESGMPIPYAAIRIKGGEMGLYSDNKGEYSIKANIDKETLQVSSIGYKTKEIKLSGVKTYDVILERSMMGEVVIVGGMISSDEAYSTPVDPKHVAVLEVKDNATMQPIKATVILERKGYHDLDSATTDKKGLYKIKRIREYETYTVKVKADGYIDQELQIKGSEFEQRKITKQIFLEKASELADYKKLDTVAVSSDYTTRKVRMIGGAMSVTSCTITRTFTDTLKLITTKITGDLKIYPNPISKGNSISIALKLKQTGVFNIQVINAAGLIVLQKQSTVNAKQYIEQVQTGKEWSSGIYYVRIFDSNNKMISTSNFLIQ